MYPWELNTLVHRHWLLTMGHRHRAVVPVRWTLCVSQAGPVQHWSVLGGRGGDRPRSATQGPSYTEGTGWRLGQGQCPQSQARLMAIYRQTNIWVLKVIFLIKQQWIVSLMESWELNQLYLLCHFKMILDEHSMKINRNW